MSFGRRLELTRRVRELGQKLEYTQAGDSVAERLEAGALSAEIDRIYLEWGLLRIEGLDLDGSKAEAKTLIEYGPEDLCQEILAVIKRECGLSDEERKN
jgi:hypothetical protein